MTTNKINNFIKSLSPATSVLSTELYGIEAGASVKLNADRIREGLSTVEDLENLSDNITKDQQRQDKALADYKIAVTSDQQRQDKALSDFKKEYTEKQTEQDGKITEVERSISTAKYVPYSGNLDDVSDDKGLAWMNVGEGRDFGHIYKFKEGEVVVKYYEYYAIVPSKEEQGQDIKIEPGFYIPWRERTRRYPCWMYSRSGGYSMSVYGAPYDILSAGSLVWDWNIEEYVKVTAKDTASETFTAVSDSGTSYTYGGGKEYSAANYSTTLYCKTTNTKIHLNGWGTMPIFEHDGVFDLDYTANSRGNPNFSEFVKQATEDIVDEGGWQDVYDTSTITADISAEVQRATTAESALSTRIDTKADASTWSANLKNQIDTDHTTLSGLSAKWTDILYSQISTDHKTLGNLNTYLSTAKRTSIDNAISLAHQQNTDTALANGAFIVNDNFAYTTGNRNIQAQGDVLCYNGTQKLSEKLNSSMQRTYATTEDMLADMANIPEGAWCAIINTHSAGVSAQSDDDIIE